MEHRRYSCDVGVGLTLLRSMDPLSTQTTAHRGVHRLPLLGDIDEDREISYAALSSQQQQRVPTVVKSPQSPRKARRWLQTTATTSPSQLQFPLTYALARQGTVQQQDQSERTRCTNLGTMIEEAQIQSQAWDEVCAAIETMMEASSNVNRHMIRNTQRYILHQGIGYKGGRERYLASVQDVLKKRERAMADPSSDNRSKNDINYEVAVAFVDKFRLIAPIPSLGQHFW